MTPKNTRPNQPHEPQILPVKGAWGLPWGMQRRLGKIFRLGKRGWKAILLAIDHPYIMGQLLGLPRIDKDIPPLLPHATTLMVCQGNLRGDIAPWGPHAIALRGTACSTLLEEETDGYDPLTNEVLSVTAEEIVQYGADIVPVQVHLGSKPCGIDNIRNFLRMKGMLAPLHIPVLWVVAVGRGMERTPKYFETAIDVAAANGAHLIKCYYFDGFDQVAAKCPVEIVVAGGKSKSDGTNSHADCVRAVLTEAYNAMEAGAGGLDYGRNIFQDLYPLAMIQALAAIVYDAANVNEAMELYQDLSGEMKSAGQWNRDAKVGADWELDEAILKTLTNPPKKG